MSRFYYNDKCMTDPTFIELPFSSDYNAPRGVDNCDQYPQSLVRYILKRYTKKGETVFDPFLGFGTTAFVAEEMERVPYGIEADGERFEWAAGQIAHWQNIAHDDAANINQYDMPSMDFCITSPPYMPREDDWNPLYSGDPAYNGYDAYLERMEYIFAQVANVMKRGAHVIVHADNIHGAVYTPLVHDLHGVISKSLEPQAEIIVRWVGEMPQQHKDYTHTHCLVFKKA